MAKQEFDRSTPSGAIKKARSKPARWRKNPVRVLHRTKYRWELWRGDQRLASVESCNGGYFWTSKLGPTRNSLEVSDAWPERKDAQSAAKKYALLHEATP